MFTTILVPLDGSEAAERALPFAERIAKAAAARLVLTHVVTPLGWDLKPPLERDLLAALESVAEPIRARGVAVEPAIYNGYHTAAGIILAQAAREHDADLMVLSTHGRGAIGRFVHGSTADEVLRHADVPVLLVPFACQQPWPTDRPLRVLAPLDGSDFAHEALGPLDELARLAPIELTLVQVVEPPTYATLYPIGELKAAREQLARLVASQQARGWKAQARAEVGPVAPTIADVAREVRADLIAIATHGRGGVGRIVLGSVAAEVLQRAAVPVLLVRPKALRRMVDLPLARAEATRISLPLTTREAEVVERALAMLCGMPESEWYGCEALQTTIGKLAAARGAQVADAAGVVQ